MSTKFFKKIKLFSGNHVAPKPNNHNAGQKRTKSTELLHEISRNPFIFLVVFVAVIAYFIAYIPSRSLPIPSIGEIASADIVAPEDLTIVDLDATEEKRTEAVNAVLPVYTLDRNVALNTEEKIREIFSSGRILLEENETIENPEQFLTEAYEKFGLELSDKDLNTLTKIKFSEVFEESLINLIVKTSQTGIILSKNLFIHGEQTKGLTLLREFGNERALEISDILDIKESKEVLSSAIDELEIEQDEKILLQKLSHFYIEPNITYDRIETERRQEEARSSVGTVFYAIKKGKVIVRKGDEVSADAVKQIGIINHNLQTRPSWIRNFAGTFLLFALLLVTVWYYFKSILKFERAIKEFIMMGVMLILSVLIYKLSFFLSDIFSETARFSLLKHTSSYYYAFPYQFGTLIFAFLTNIPVAIVFTMVNSLLVGYFFNANFLLVIFSLIGGFIAIYGIKYYGKQNRNSTFKAGVFLIAPINIFVIITFHFIGERLGEFNVFVSEALMAVIGGILSAALAFLFLPVFENLFDYATQTKLLELTNSDLPIFRQMAIEAPGSYHHSLIVASLVEKAAEEIKADPMVAKAGALYHDIGKIKRPEYFIENRSRTIDRHKDLKPSMSTLVIVNHVKEGVERARKLKLPKVIRDIVEQHHGNSLVKYFYEKAKEEYDPEMQTVGEENYRYSGPKPTTKESALVMLADSVEAASRSLKTPSKPNLKRVISEIFNNYLQDGQLDDCDFSLKELRIVASSFLETLYMIYHHRVEYPGFEFEPKQTKTAKKTKTANDRNLKSATQTHD
jgi:putative nucleotidyltransferase with HDIG domain